MYYIHRHVAYSLVLKIKIIDFRKVPFIPDNSVNGLGMEILPWWEQTLESRFSVVEKEFNLRFSQK